MPKKPELLSPAGDFESLKAAVYYGADAVYLGTKLFSMRAGAQNFDKQGLFDAVEFAHNHEVKVYLACNTLPRSGELKKLPVLFKTAREAGVDALITTDLGVLELAKRSVPEIELHASTQMGVVNYASANALFTLGVKRVVLARELSLEEISEIRMNSPRSLEIECFVHGAMCVSFSGRCLLSNYLTGRDGNRGECAQPCRWKYALNEVTRPGEYFPIVEEDDGTHILNARDLCMIEHIPALVDAGISSLKIEGRAKSAYYTAVVTNAYRMAIDLYMQGKPFDRTLLDEVEKVSHRNYCTGFYFGRIQNGQIYKGEAYKRSWDIVAVVTASDGGQVECVQRNPFSADGVFEAVEPGKTGKPVQIEGIFDQNGTEIERASHPGMKVFLNLNTGLQPNSMIRKLADV